MNEGHVMTLQRDKTILEGGDWPNFPIRHGNAGPDPTHCLHNWRNYQLILDHFTEFHGRETMWMA